MGFEPIIDDDPRTNLLAFPPGVRRGYVPRDYAVDPVEMFAPPDEMPLIPRSEWSARIKELTELKARISDVRNTGDGGRPIAHLDQGPVGYCWGHSVAHCVTMARALNNQPYVPLSAYAVCAIIKGGRDQGGWCGLAAKFIRDVGIPAQKFWPQGSRSLSHDTPEMRANAALHKTAEDWVDLTVPVHGQNLTFDQVASCLLSGVPVAVDFNWQAHSVCALDLVEVEAGSFGLRILNSWSGWGDNGTGIYRGRRAVPDGAVALRVTGASPV